MSNFYKAAFTLIELLVVIAVIGILSGLIVVSMSGTTDKARIAKAQVFSNSTRNSLMSSLISEWKFDGPTTIGSAATNNDTLDTWGTNNATASGTALIVKGGNDCIYGKCLDLTPIDSSTLNRAYLNGISQTSSVLTISYWMYRRGGVRYTGGVFTTGEPSGMIYLGDQSGNVIVYNGFYDSSSWLYLYFDNVAVVSNTFSLSKNINNEWHFVTISFDGNYVKFYLDGNIVQPVISRTGGILRSATTWNMSIGNYTTYWLNGRLDEVRLYKEGISISEIKQQYFSGLNNLMAKNSITKEEYLSRINEYAIK